ncbi:MAG: DNA-directed RNA polymerase subunit L [Candidatus Aenigmatarchaeota archaeon]
MEVKVLKEEKNVLLVELVGESETFANLLREELWNVRGVVEAAYIREHPELSQPKLWIKTEGINAREALKIAIDNLIKKLKDLKEKYKKAL